MGQRGGMVAITRIEPQLKRPCAFHVWDIEHARFVARPYELNVEYAMIVPCSVCDHAEWVTVLVSLTRMQNSPEIFASHLEPMFKWALMLGAKAAAVDG